MKRIFPLIIFLLVSAARAQGLPVITAISPELTSGNCLWFGWDIAGGDFNGDGIGDIAVASPRSDMSHPDPDSARLVCGRIDIYFGPLPPGDHDGISLPPDITIFGEHPGDQFGISIANAGDFDGDGCDDLLVGANVLDSKGGAYVFPGGSPFDTSPCVTFLGEALVDNFGYSVTGIGDQNGDGFDDVLVGSLYNDALGPRTGRCYIYFGGDPADSVADFVITGLDSLDDFGVCVDGPFDFNGDGGPDFVVGAVQAGGYWFKPGAAYVFFGGAALDSFPDRTMSGVHPMEFFGGSVAALGDLDCDGFDEAISGGYNHHEPPDSGLGRAVVVFGNSSDSLIIIGDMPGQFLGGEVASAGDIDGDFRAEFAVSQNIDPTGAEIGFVRIFGIDRETDTLAVEAECYNPGGSTDTWFAYRMAPLRDVSGDGRPDFAISDPKMTVDPWLFEGEGRVYIYEGWQEFFPIEAEVIDPCLSGYFSACLRQGITFRLRRETGLAGIEVIVRVESSYGTLEYTLDSTQLAMPDDSTLIFTPERDWVDEDIVEMTLTSARVPPGDSLLIPAFDYWYMDFTPPQIRALTGSGITDDPYPTFRWLIEGYSIYHSDTNDIVVICGGDTIHPEGIYEVFHDFLV